MCFAFCFTISGETHIWIYMIPLSPLVESCWICWSLPPTGKALNILNALDLSSSPNRTDAVALDSLRISTIDVFWWMILTYIFRSQQLRTSWKLGNSIWRYLLIWEYLEAQFVQDASSGDRRNFTSFCLSPSLVMLRFQYARIVQIHWVGLREHLQETHGFLPSNIGLSCKFSHHPILWQISCLDSRQSEQVEHFYASGGTPTLTSPASVSSQSVCHRMSVWAVMFVAFSTH